jgi:hypothetical protein
MHRGFLAFALAAGLSTSAMAAEFKGYIIDEKCARIVSMNGDAHCATKCIKDGSPAVLVTDDFKVYKITDQARVIPMAGRRVTISGKAKGDTLTVDRIK